MKPFTWSYSALTTFELCPKKYYHLYFLDKNHPDRVKDEDSSFSADGKIVHDAMFARVVKGTPLPLNLRYMERAASPFAAARGEKHGEMKLAINRDFAPCGYFDGDVYIRVVIDLTIVKGSTAVVVDWKTGKVKDDPTQMALTAAVLHRWMPEVTEFRTVFVWLAHNKATPHKYTPEQFTAVWNELIPRANKIEEARKTTSFPAKENGLCGWCPVKQCPHWKDRG